MYGQYKEEEEDYNEHWFLLILISFLTILKQFYLFHF